MDYEQKYKDLVKAVKELQEANPSDKGIQNWVNKNIPELAESEDERIRKWIVRTLKSLNNSSIQIDGAYEMMLSAIAWLEKQGEQRPITPKFRVGDVITNGKEFPYCTIEYIDEQVYYCDYTNIDIVDADKNWKLVEQKPTDKIEPKFKVGDWVVLNENHNSIYQVEKIENYHYVLRHILGGAFGESFGLESLMRLWTIQDAKDGDVLVLNGEVFIYAHRKQLYSIDVAHCFVDNVGVFHFDGEFGYTEKGNSIHPATASQRNLLFTKMKEAGYEWDADKKEIRKLHERI